MRAVLVGFMGSGKTTIGQLLAKELQVSHVDLDQIIVEFAGKSINDIFAQAGEQTFRRLEHELLQQQLAKDGILSTGGGTPMLDANLKLLQNSSAPIILLEASTQTITRRVKDEGGRPLVNRLTSSELASLKQSRDTLYYKCADWVVKTDQRTPQEIIAEILPKLVV